MVPPYQMACAVATDNCCLSSAAHAPDRDRAPSRNRNCVGVGQAGGPMPLEFDPMPFGYSVRGHCRKERRKARWFCNPKGIVSSSPATESARLPWVGVRAIFNPNGGVSPLRHRTTTPLGLADITRFSQGSSRLATRGFGAESLWDSSESSARLAQILTRHWTGHLPNART